MAANCHFCNPLVNLLIIESFPQYHLADNGIFLFPLEYCKDTHKTMARYCADFRPYFPKVKKCLCNDF